MDQKKWTFSPALALAGFGILVLASTARSDSKRIEVVHRWQLEGAQFGNAYSLVRSAAGNVIASGMAQFERGWDWAGLMAILPSDASEFLKLPVFRPASGNINQIRGMTEVKEADGSAFYAVGALAGSSNPMRDVRGVILKSVDQGRSWKEVHSVEMVPGFVTMTLGVLATPKGEIYAVGHGDILPDDQESQWFAARSTSFGSSWERVPLPDLPYLHREPQRLAYHPSRRILAAGTVSGDYDKWERTAKLIVIGSDSDGSNWKVLHEYSPGKDEGAVGWDIIAHPDGSACAIGDSFGSGNWHWTTVCSPDGEGRYR